MQLLTHKPLHVWCAGGKTYVYTPACSVYVNGKMYDLTSTPIQNIGVTTFDTDTLSVYLVVSDDTSLSYVSDHPVEDTEDYEIFPTDEEIENGLVVSNDLGDGGSFIVQGIHSVNLPLARVENGVVTINEDIKCLFH